MKSTLHYAPRDLPRNSTLQNLYHSIIIINDAVQILKPKLLERLKLLIVAKNIFFTQQLWLEQVH